MKAIDLFAGPGGLGEGFSLVFDSNGKRVFDICLSIEKDYYAHKTLLLRHFVRQYPKNKIPEEYYDVIRENNSNTRQEKLNELFENPKFKKQAYIAKRAAWLAELGAVQFPSELVDRRIREVLNNDERWILIGGPPCQAYSVAGRSRVGGINENDNRVYLYKEYLRIIAAHRPDVFVMENVAGLLSAKINHQSIFRKILSDLKNPGSVFNEYQNTPNYRIFSLTHLINEYDLYNNPVYSSDKDYLIKSEKYGIPQARHRVILLGLREDIVVNNIPILEKQKTLNLENVIGNLPKLRSGLSKSTDNYLSWKNAVSEVLESDLIGEPNFQDPLLKDAISEIIKKLENRKFKRGKNYIKCNNIFKDKLLKDWYEDQRIEGVLNHETRAHIKEDLWRYIFASCFVREKKRIPKLDSFRNVGLKPNHKNESSGIFMDRFRVQLPDLPATTITSHISKDGHYYIHYDPYQCRSLTVREAARIQTFPDNYYFWGPRTEQYKQVGNAVPPYLAFQIANITRDIMDI